MTSRITRRYNEDFKKNAVSTLLRPQSPGLSAIARKFNIPTGTLYSWKLKYANSSNMKNNNKKIKKWSPEQKLEIILKTSSMSNNELGEYLRSNGLHSCDINSFKEEFLSSLNAKISTSKTTSTPEVSKLKKNNKALERDLTRTKKALAEQSARIILLKKSHEIWGDPEEEE